MPRTSSNLPHSPAAHDVLHAQPAMNEAAIVELQLGWTGPDNNVKIGTRTSAVAARALVTNLHALAEGLECTGAPAAASFITRFFVFCLEEASAMTTSVIDA